MSSRSRPVSRILGLEVASPPAGWLNQAAEQPLSAISFSVEGFVYLRR